MDRRVMGITGALLAVGALIRTEASGEGEKKPVNPVVSSTVASLPLVCDESAESGLTKTLADLAHSNGSPRKEFLIAVLPDPIVTHLALDFDRAVESIISAAGESEYSLQQRWIPWRSASDKDLPLLADRSCVKRRNEARNQQPGLLTFYRTDRALAIFLVGEGPASGVNREQLGNAVRYIREGSSCDLGNLTIRAIGPSFSGSLPSLAAQLDRYPDVKFHFASGMVTRKESIETFRRAIGRHGGQYHSTIETDDRAMELFFAYAGGFWSSRTRVALLAEQGTAYGTGFSAPASFRTNPGWPHLWFTLRYPREISRLRNAYQEEKPPAPEAVQEKTAPAVRLTLKDGKSDSGDEAEIDGVPAFSRLQSPASQEAVMSAIANTVRRERADFVGIVATDVLDTLFLSRYLRSHCPDTRLFTPDADLLFTSHTDGDSLEGLLSITSYPLFSRNQHWTMGMDGEDQRIQFANRYSQAIYNASRFLLDPAGRYAEYSRPGNRKNQPPLWLTVMGRDGYWPLALLDDPKPLSAVMLDRPDAAADPAEQLHPEMPGKGWYLCFWLSVAFSALHAAYLLYLLKEPAEVSQVAGPTPALDAFFGLLSKKLFTAYPEPDDRLSENQRVFLSAAALSAGCALFILDAPLIVFKDAPHPMEWTVWYCAAGGLAVAAQLIAAAALCWKRTVWLARVKKSWTVPNSAILAAAVWLLAGLTVGVWSSLLGTQFHRSGFFLAYRCFSLANGVAPNVPLLLLGAALFCWSVTQLNRVTHVERRRAMTAAVKNAELSGEWLMEKVDRSIDDLFSTNVWVPALSVMLVWLLLFVPWRTVRSFEFARYDVLMFVVLGAVYWAMAIAWIQFLWCWNEFKDFLQWLERQPIRGAFSRLRKEISWVPLVSQPPEHPLFISSRSWDCLKCMRSFAVTEQTDKNSLERLQKSIAPEAGKIEEILNKLDLHLGEGIDDAEYLHLQRQFQSAARKIQDDLQANAWQKRRPETCSPIHESGGKEEKPTSDEQLIILKEEFVAYRYLIFIRYVFRNLRNLLGFIIVAFILSVVALSSYPFQGGRWIGVASGITFLALGTGIAVVLAGMDRDAILSRISATKPNEIGATFYLRLAQFGALPLLTVVASQFPAVNRFLFSWVRPALEALK